MIVVEGPDGAGKTTLVNELSKEFGLRHGERGTSDHSKLYTVTRRDTYTALGDAVKGTEQVRIWDRLYYSELVYAKTVGRPVEFNTTEQTYVQRMIEALHCPIIVCLPDYPVVAKNAGMVEQMDGVNENLVEIYNSYVRLCDGTFPDHTHIYDYVTEHGGVNWYMQDRGPYQFAFTPLAAIKDDICDYLEERRERTWA